MTTDSSVQQLRDRAQRFLERAGRRPRVLVGALQPAKGQYPAQQLGSLLADIGFDVDLQPVLKGSNHVAVMAMDNDVHAVAILGADRATEAMLLDLMHALNSAGCADVILAIDHLRVCDSLRQSGSHPVVWLPDTGISSAACLLAALERIR
jgi:methylmalonyl-CoA mutase